MCLKCPISLFHMHFVLQFNPFICKEFDIALLERLAPPPASTPPRKPYIHGSSYTLPQSCFKYQHYIAKILYKKILQLYKNTKKLSQALSYRKTLYFFPFKKQSLWILPASWYIWHYWKNKAADLGNRNYSHQGDLYH